MALYDAELRSLVMTVRSADVEFDEWWEVDSVHEAWARSWNTDRLTLAMSLFGALYHRMTDYNGTDSGMRDAWFKWRRLSDGATEVAFPPTVAILMTLKGGE